MTTLSTNDRNGDYWVEEETHNRFFNKPQLCLYIQEYVMNMLSVQIEISLQIVSKDYPWERGTKYRIQVVYTDTHQPEIQKTVFDLIRNCLQKMSDGTYYNDTVLKWLNWFRMSGISIKFLHKLINKKIDDLFTIINIPIQGPLYAYHLPYRQSSSNINFDKFVYFIKNEILYEIISLPFPYQRSPQLEIELQKIQSDENTDDEVVIVYNSLAPKIKQKEIGIFGYYKKVNELKRKILNIIENNILITYKLNPMDTFLMNNFFDTFSNQLNELETKYENFGVNIRIRLNEFSAPRHLKDEIESSIQQILFDSSTMIRKDFESIQLFKPIAENEEKHLQLIAQKYSCYIKTIFNHTYQFYPIPKASISNLEISKSIVAQSDMFSSSSDVFKKMIIGNGSIELRIGDIALQEVDTIIISSTLNGLKEGLIERAGSFDYEKTHLQTDGTMYTETDGGQLKCKRILFSNWLPISLINNENFLHLSIQSFISKSIEYTKNVSSIAFAVPDSCTDENILAKEMVMEAKRQLEMNKFELKISFVLLPEQQTLYEQFSTFIETTEDVFAYIDWPMTTIKIKLIGINVETITRCQQRLIKYLSRCIVSEKLTYSNNIFQSWDQHTINSFYKYCKDRYVLLKLDEIQLIGPSSGIQKVKKKLNILSALIKEKSQCTTSISERPSSSIRSETKLYNIVISYNRKDIRKCQRLINRLIDEGFSVGIGDEKYNIHLQMNKCDCIILCISENYYENLSCREEAKYAYQTNKKVFLVKIQSNPLLGWDYYLFEGKLFFRSFGSDEYFNLEYERLLIELLRYTKPGFTSLLQRRSSFIQQDTNQFQENLLNKKSVISARQLTFLEERWLYKLENIPKPNLSIYSGDTSDFDPDIYPYKKMANTYQISDSCIQLFVPKYSGRTFVCTRSSRSIMEQPISRISVDKDRIYGHCNKKSQLLIGQSFTYSSDDFIPRRGQMNFFNPYVPTETELRNEEEMKQRQKFENPEKMKHVREKLAKYFMDKYKYYTKEQMDIYSKFAQQMKDNTMAFETFCSTNNTIVN